MEHGTAVLTTLLKKGQEMNDSRSKAVMTRPADLQHKGQWHPAKKVTATSQHAHTTLLSCLFLAASPSSKH
jgi:hypothetical protein